MPATQTCRICRRELPLNTAHYYPEPSNRLGFRTACAPCLSDEAKKRYDADPETFRQRARDRRERRAEQFRATGVWDNPPLIN